MNDVDKFLAELRQAIRDWEIAAPRSQESEEASERATSAAASIDYWLTHGGALPRAWSNAALVEFGARPEPASGDRT